MYNGYDNLSEDFEDLALGKNKKDFVNYCYVIDRYGNFDKETEVQAIGIK